MMKKRDTMCESRRRQKGAEMGQTFTLANGVEIPAVGFGTFKTAENKDEAIISEAIRQGYRHLDTAAFYNNEEEVGNAWKKSGISREEFFLTSKIWRENLGYDNVFQEFEKTCQKLGTDYLDLYLIHWPRPSDMSAEWRALDVETWKALEELYRSKKVRAIGVSNFLPHHLNNLMDRTGVIPLVNQLEFHPGYIQKAAVDFCQRQGIQIEAWSPIGRAKMLNEPLLIEMAEKYQVSVAQICIRFCLECGVLPLPKSSAPERMQQNLDVFGFRIEEDDMHRLMTLPQLGWSGEHPDRERVTV